MNTFKATKSQVFNRGAAPDAFLQELIVWARTAQDEIFAANPHFDIYSKVKLELGPFTSLIQRKSVMLEVLRVLALFESECNWKEGPDSSRRTETTKENAEAGAWQESWDARKLDPALAKLLSEQGVMGGVEFQQRIKSDHPLAMEFTARILRIDMKNFERIANGPVRKGDEREKTWPDRPKLWSSEQSIYPWLSRESVAEFQAFLS